MKIYGISGTNGAGKDSVGELLARDFNYLFVSVTDMLRVELKKRGLPITRQNTSELSAEWRREHGMAVLIDKAMEYFKAQEKSYAGVVISSLRHPHEAKKIHELGGEVIWVDADPKVRYDRIQKNAHLRNRAGEDNRTYEEFLEDDKREMHPIGDEATLNMSGVKQLADIFLTNDGSDLSAFEEYVNKQLGLKN